VLSDAFTLVAQNTWNGAVVLGTPVTAWRGVDLESAVTRAGLNDEAAGQGKTGDALGHPFEAVAWLANLLNRRGRMLGRPDPRSVFLGGGQAYRLSLCRSDG